jgi:Domain of unknown function (DUF4386)
MNAASIAEGLPEASPRVRARLAGALFLLGLIIAASGETFIHGKLAIAAGLIAVALYVVMTLLMFAIFRVVHRGVAFIALAFSFAGLALEALRWNPYGVDIALVFHGLYCILIGCLVLRSIFVPRILGPLMVLSGLTWLSNASPAVADRLSPYNVAIGLLGEAALMLWLLVLSVNERRWREQASAAKIPSPRGELSQRPRN